MVSPQTIEAQAHATAMVKRAHTSFYWAMRILARPKRNAMYAIYAFCRVVDDIADDPGEAPEKRQQLQFWRKEIGDIFAGNPSGPLGRSLALAGSRYDLQKEDFLAIINGMETDVGGEQSPGRVRITNLDELDLYCDRVAGSVGRLSNQVFGVDRQTGNELAKCLGRALQLTNILRDLMEDAQIDRLYLPRDMLEDHGIEQTDPMEVLKAPAIAAVCAQIATMAEQYFAEANVVLSRLARSKVRPAIIMMAMYKHVLLRLNARGWGDLNRPVSLSRFTRIGIAIRYGLFGP